MTSCSSASTSAPHARSISAGNGQRQWIESYVGWPKDFIAAQVVGKPVLFGSEVLEYRLSVDVCRPLQHGIIKEGINRNEEAVKEIIRHLIELAGPRRRARRSTPSSASPPTR